MLKVSPDCLYLAYTSKGDEALNRYSRNSYFKTISRKISSSKLKVCYILNFKYHVSVTE